MGVAYFIVPERPVDGVETVVDGKALAHCRPQGVERAKGRNVGKHFETLARDAGVRPLMEFFSVAPEDVISLLSETGDEPPPDDLPPEAWFSATEGLRTVRGLIAHLEAVSDAAADQDRLLSDLREFERVLDQLEAADVRWHLAIDF
jgi:hypothetical protein